MSITEVVIPFVKNFINPYDSWRYLNEKYKGRVGLESCCFERSSFQWGKMKTQAWTIMREFWAFTRNRFWLSKELVILLILNFLPKQFNVLIKTLINRQNLPSFEELEAILINDKLHIKFDGDSNEKAMFTKGKGLPTNFKNHGQQFSKQEKEGWIQENVGSNQTTT